MIHRLTTFNCTYVTLSENEDNDRIVSEGYVPAKSLPSPNGKWGLLYGTHRGTVMSRDQDSPIYDCDSYEALMQELHKVAKDWAGRGYFIWFAIAIAPDGTRHKMLHGAYYKS